MSAPEDVLSLPRRCARPGLRALAIISVCLFAFSCGKADSGGDDDGGDTPGGDGGIVEPPCEGIGCNIVDCAAQGKPPTTVSGTVFAPNGTLPLYAINVYVPRRDPGPLPDGVTCGSCRALPGSSYAGAGTDVNGRFTLNNVPAGDNIPLIVTHGKWRRQYTIPTVTACQDNPIDPENTRFPRTSAEGDIPRIAISTGEMDALECLVRKLGVADSEFTTDAGPGRVHLFNGTGTNRFVDGFPGGSGEFPSSTTLWATAEKLANYDITILSCDGAQLPEMKPQSAMDAIHDYAGRGGRIFMSHWHNIWIGGEEGNPSHGVQAWQGIGTWNFAAAQDQDQTTASVNMEIPTGQAFASWLQNVGASTTPTQIPINEARYTLTAVDETRSDRLVYLRPELSNNHVSIQDMQFTTPLESPPAARCGKVVFSDMHVSSGSLSQPSVPFPTDCSTDDLSPQEKALAFILFDISSCIGGVR